MGKRKAILEEVNKAWSIAQTLKEAQATQQAPPTQVQGGQKAPQQPAQAQPQQGTQAPVQANPQVIQTNMSQGMAALMQSLPSILKTFTATVGDKDGQLDVAGQPQNNQQAQGQRAPQQPAQVQPQQGAQTPAQPIKEEKKRELFFDETKFNSEIGGLNEGGIVGLVASAPAILQFGGKLLQKLGSKTNPNIIQKFGGQVSKAGEALHHTYIGAIEKVLTPFMPNADAQTKHKAAEGVFMVLVSGLFIGSMASPNTLSMVKGKELADYVRKIAPSIMSSVGFA
jgi:hypothetical protein